MNVRRIRTTLWSLSAALLAGSGAVAFVALAETYELDVSDRTLKIGQTREASGPPPIPPLQEFESVWEVDLRRTLFDAPVQEEKKVPPPPLRVKLTGTVIEPGHTLAMFALQGGKMELRRVGEQVSGAEILEIDSTSATLRYHGETITLKTGNGDER